MSTAMNNTFLDNDDIQYHFHNTINWDRIVPLVERNFTLADGPESVEEAVDLYSSILEEAGKYLAREVAPKAHEIDESGSAKLVDGEVQHSPMVKKIFEGFKNMELYGISSPRELGGMNCPVATSFMLYEMIARADCGTMTHFGFHGGIASALLAWCIREGSVEIKGGELKIHRFRDALEKLISGEEWGAMVLTEPDSGSDLAALSTTAVEQPDGSWQLTGEKIFISSGDGQHHIVLARSEGPDSGLGGLSLFYVPRLIERDGKQVRNFEVTKVEKKVGHISSATVSLLYDNSYGELLGSRGQGFEQMLLLMNNARIAIAFEGLGIGEAAYRMALKYATERYSMGKQLKEHELIADMLQEMDTDIRGIRALAFDALNDVEVYVRLEMQIFGDPPADPEELKRITREANRRKWRARQRTPLLKYLAGEKVVEWARKNMQIHGGMGYIRETGADKLLRDALVVPIYEGTSQIQALMALKDHMAYLMKNPAGFVRKAWQARVNSQVKTGLERKFHRAEVLKYRCLETIMWRIFGNKLRAEFEGPLSTGSWWDRLSYLRSRFMRKWDDRADFSFGMLHAERLTKVLADVAIAEVLLKQAAKTPARMKYAERYINRMMPRITALTMEITGAAVDPDKLVSEVATPTNGAHVQEPIAIG